MRDYRKLKAFELIDQLVLMIYKVTASFPREEQFGLTSQLRRAAVSAASNIVEGCGCNTESDFLHFLDMAFGSFREAEYQLSLAYRLGYLNESTYSCIQTHCIETSKVLAAFIRSIRKAK